jgi:hypothetical protein
VRKQVSISFAQRMPAGSERSPQRSHPTEMPRRLQARPMRLTVRDPARSLNCPSRCPQTLSRLGRSHIGRRRLQSGTRNGPGATRRCLSTPHLSPCATVSSSHPRPQVLGFGNQLTPMLKRNSILLRVFLSLLSTNSIASTGGTPVKARRRMTTLLYSSG